MKTDTHFPTKNVTSLFLYVNKDSYVTHASITTKSQGWEDTGYEWVEVEWGFTQPEEVTPLMS